MMNVFIGKYLCVQVISYGTLAGCCFKDLLVDNCCWLSGSLVFLAGKPLVDAELVG